MLANALTKLRPPLADLWTIFRRSDSAPPYGAGRRRRRPTETSEPQGRVLSPVGPKRSGGGAKRLDRAVSRVAVRALRGGSSRIVIGEFRFRSGEGGRSRRPPGDERAQRLGEVRPRRR